MRKDLRNFIAGVLVGVSNAIPGVSGGTMAVILDIYDKLLEAVSIKHWKEHKRFLITFVIGAAAGIIGLSNVIIPLRDNYPIILGFIFMGLIVGSLPLILRHATGCEGKPKPFNIILGIFAFILMVTMSLMDRDQLVNVSVNQIDGFNLQFDLMLVATSAVAAIAMIIPGISGSLVMLLMGTYTVVIEGIATMNFAVLIPVGIGVLIGLGVGIKGIKRALELCPQAMYFIILGLVVGSLWPVYPGWKANGQGVIAIVAFVIFAVISYMSSRNEGRENE